jgi:arsenite methyltransferase
VSRRGSYGIDAPYVPIGFSVGALFAAVLGVMAFRAEHAQSAGIWFATAAWFTFASSTYLYATFRGKFEVWSELLGSAGLEGDERALDIGCGRGAVLLLAAERLPRGKAVGIDLWSRADQSGNAIDVTRENAAKEGVADRIELITGDMTKLPFEDASFDLVVSSLAIHNVPSPAGRETAIREIYRALAPGGRALLADFRYVKDYARTFESLGASEVRTRGLGWRLWYGGPHAGTRLVEATKPDQSPNA